MKRNFLKIILLSLNIFLSINIKAQSGKKLKQPKLVIGLVIDQMRWDYLSRFYDEFSNDGFKKLMKKGFSCDNVFIPYVPSYTAPGHTCIYTGSVPAIHGIAGNEWFDKQQNRNINATEDSSVNTVGVQNNSGRNSPVSLLCPTIGDELRLNKNFRNKVISIALKDRASILPGGHSSNGSYWCDEKTGRWITSSFYMNELPDWVYQFNELKLPDEYIKTPWETSKPVSMYLQSTGDSMLYESVLMSTNNRNTFPHVITDTARRKYEEFRYTPDAINYTFKFAQQAIEHEKLGGSNITDMLCLSISSTDLVGHKFGPNSIETEDIYIRLDKEIAQFLNYLDKKIGRDNYTLFLSADHGVESIPAFLNEHNLAGGIFTDDQITKYLYSAVNRDLKATKRILKVENSQIYVSNAGISDTTFANIKSEIISALKQLPFISNAFETAKLSSTTLPEKQKKMFANSFNAKRSGDIYFMVLPGFISRSEKGTTHGTQYLYDTHIPLIWYGKNIKKGSSNREMSMTDIAPTLSSLLNMQPPACSVGDIIYELFR